MVLTQRTLGEICDEVGGTIRTGPFGSQLHESDYREEGLPVVMPKDIIGGRVSTESIARIGSNDEVRLSQHKLNKGDIVYGRRGDIGRRALITSREHGWLCGTGCLRLSLGGSILDPAFLYYYLGLPRVTAWISNQAVGATLPNLNTAILRGVTIAYPTLPIQKKISSILSAYDKLIENNTRRIKILEEMAQATYREWFVHFRFPGHKKVKLINSPFGLIPNGWSTGRLDEAVVLQRGFDLPGSSRRQGNVPVYAATGVAGTHDESKVRGPGVITGRSGSLGTVIYVSEDFWPLNTTLWVKEFRRSTPLHAYFLLSSLDFEQFNSGAAVPTLNRNDVHGLPVVLPPDAILTQFDKHVVPIYELISSLVAKNANLRRTRDLLLPKLISGELDVSDLDIRVERAV